MKPQKGDVIAVAESGRGGTAGRVGEIVEVDWFFEPWAYSVRINDQGVRVRLREQDFKVIGDVR